MAGTYGTNNGVLGFSSGLSVALRLAIRSWRQLLQSGPSLFHRGRAAPNNAVQLGFPAVSGRRPNLVYDDELYVVASAILRVLSASEPKVGPDRVLGHQLLPPGSDRRAVEAHALSQDRDQAAPFLKSSKGALDMQQAVPGVVLHNAAACRAERRVHQNCRWTDIVWQQVVNDFCVQVVSFKSESFQQSTPAGADFVADNSQAQRTRPDCEATGPRRRFEDDILWL